MDFLIADTFTDSLARLTAEEQKAAKTTAFDLQVNPAHPGLQFHKLDKAKDTRFASVRVSRDIRLIVHRTQSSLLLCYVGHHDAAYVWAERRKLETHPTTGAAQLVEVRETIEEIKVPNTLRLSSRVPLSRCSSLRYRRRCCLDTASQANGSVTYSRQPKTRSSRSQNTFQVKPQMLSWNSRRAQRPSHRAARAPLRTRSSTPTRSGASA